MRRDALAPAASSSSILRGDALASAASSSWRGDAPAPAASSSSLRGAPAASSSSLRMIQIVLIVADRFALFCYRCRSFLPIGGSSRIVAEDEVVAVEFEQLIRLGRAGDAVPERVGVDLPSRLLYVIDNVSDHRLSFPVRVLRRFLQILQFGRRQW